MEINLNEPTGTRDRERFVHPSYGFIRASRVQGHAELFDSPFSHQHFVQIEIGPAEKEISLGGSHIFGSLRGSLITVNMSEIQFAQFVTSMNVGSGAPCTIEWVNGGQVEPPPADPETKEKHRDNVKQDMQNIVSEVSASIAAVECLIDKGKANKRELQAALGEVTRIKQHLEKNLPFMMEQFQRQMEKVVASAKAEATAHAMALGERFTSDMPTMITVDAIEN